MPRRRSGVYPPAAGFTEIDRAEHIASRVELGICRSDARVYLCGEVKDDLRRGPCDDVEQFGCLDVGRHEGERPIGAQRAFQIGGKAATQVVDADHLMAVREQSVDQV